MVDKTFNAGVKVETANVDKRGMQFSYKDGENFVFMDMETYDQIHVTPEVVGDAANYLLEGFEAVVAMYEGARCTSSCRPPSSWSSSTPSRASRATAPPAAPSPPAWRPGYEIGVPLFITTGEKIKVDTRSGEYLGRVNS